MKALTATREAFGMTFDCPPGYLDTPSVGIPPLPAVDALLAAIRDWQVGATVSARFGDSVDAARRAFAVLCGVPAPTVAIGGSVSELVGLTASAAPDGTRVLTAAGEFASVIFPFAAHARRRSAVAAESGGPTCSWSCPSRARRASTTTRSSKATTWASGSSSLTWPPTRASGSPRS
jgi:selenocysteine lyase/cysteine desulfurase